jgi:hypothetical protein
MCLCCARHPCRWHLRVGFANSCDGKEPAGERLRRCFALPIGDARPEPRVSLTKPVAVGYHAVWNAESHLGWWELKWIDAANVKARFLLRTMTKPELRDEECEAAKRVACARLGKRRRTPQGRAVRMLQHATPAAHLFDCPHRKLGFAGGWFRDTTQHTPATTRRMRHDWSATGPLAGIPINVPHVAVHAFVNRISAGE